MQQIIFDITLGFLNVFNTVTRPILQVQQVLDIAHVISRSMYVRYGAPCHYCI